MYSLSALIPIVSFGLFFFVLCKENLDRRTGTVIFDIQRQFFNLIVNLAICLTTIVISIWVDNGSMVSTGLCSWACMILYGGYMFAFENHVAAALLKKRNKILTKAKEDQQNKRKRT